ncbi:indole-3-glycerol-phosphate synthase [Citrifermentans bemidjiense Bem]|uniref:Indole-3-glycerol phosphate synthase n=1 Tax=Citrifermentans bemidjiense (strain ATCC BAA-1014 / DSM 16622 / JCM 12645 / Bem) TaxID=404380 RepID=B5EBU7_CITBB|nr:indole-3-glycerol phosphate synthase TrpC [Citrifermentans bemidjiense]ACH38971.1 indole-3-glycerol-phosphate synthase [Citrifermentans bemidjiense Bem]
MTQLPDVLKKIVDYKQGEVAAMKAEVPLNEIMDRLAELEDHPRGFQAALINSLSSGWTPIIAEVKKGSPSKGLIRPDFDPLQIARTYQENGATCLSILTDEHFFMGHLSYLAAIREEVSLPLLRKDFIFDPYQIYQARAAGADAILLIAAMLDLPQLRDFAALAQELSMDVLLEVHDEKELETALQTDCSMIGINNRDLRSFVVDIRTSERLAALVPQGRLVVAESGINRREEIVHLMSMGLHAFLIGESLMREDDFGAKLRELVG